jgi:hypothetical protein
LLVSAFRGEFFNFKLHENSQPPEKVVFIYSILALYLIEGSLR